MIFQKIRVILVCLYESSIPGLKEKYLILISASGSNLWWNVMKYMLESRLLGEISITSEMLMTPPLWQKVKKN